jgi:hypothetical protein
LTLNFKPFEDHNRAFDKPVFYNQKGDAVDTWIDGLYYPDDGIEEIYVDSSDDVVMPITNQLFNEYIQSGSEKSYVIWLENLVTELRTPPKELK